MLGLAECLVLAAAGKIAAVEEIGEGVFVQHAMDAHVALIRRKIDAVVARAAAVEFLLATLKQSKARLQGFFFQIGGGNVQRLQNLKLDLGREVRKLRRADVIENDL